jgi:hypothetical protein
MQMNIFYMIIAEGRLAAPGFDAKDPIFFSAVTLITELEDGRQKVEDGMDECSDRRA